MSEEREQGQQQAEAKVEVTPEPIKLDPVVHDSVLGSGAPTDSPDEE